MLSSTVTKKVGALLLLFTLGGLTGLVAVLAYFVATKGIGPFFDVAGRQRMVSEQMLAAVQGSANGDPSARDALRARATLFAVTLSALDTGGRVGDLELAPPPDAVRPELRAIRAHWDALNEPIRVVLELPATDAAARAARELLRERLPELRDASHRLVVAFELWHGRYRERIVAILYAVAIGDLVLFAVGLLLARYMIGRPILLIEKAARRVQEGDYSARVPILTNDELAVLARTFNGMSERVGGLIASLAAQEQRFRELVQDVDAIVWERDAVSGRLLFVNRQVEVALGIPADRFLAEPDLWDRLVHADDQQEAIDHSRDALERTDRATYEARFVVGDGRIVWLRCAARAVRDPTGKLIAIRGVAVDITERRNVEERLRLLERATESIEQGILVAAIPNGESPPHQIQLVNRAFEQITGWTRSEVLGRDPGFLRGPLTDPAARAAIVGAIRDQRTHTGEILNYRKDGRPFWNSFTLSPIPAASGRASHYVGIVTDVTEQKRTQEQLRQAMKMEAVGRLAGGVAHDFNNILTAIIGYADLLAIAPDLSERAKRAALEIRDAGERAAELTRQLLAFSRRQVLEPRVIALNEHVEAIRSMLRRLIREDVDFCLALQPGLSSIKVDPSQLEQVIVNLVVNARDAMPDGGKLTIETGDVELDATYAASHPGVQPGPHVLFAVTDTGTGMSPEVLSHIFEPFFTTKPVGQGTGLGLATVYGIVRQSGGHVWAYSEPGQGTTIKVYFPRASGTPQPVSRGDAVSQAGGTETVLVVEDEDAVRGLTAQVLGAAGYAVLDAASGAEALAIAERHAGRIAMALVDVVMPKMNGRELAERLVKLRPELRIVFTSGYTDNAIVHHGVLDEGVEFLGKPYTPAALLRRVREVLDRTT